jgi:hypothetical protein
MKKLSVLLFASILLLVKPIYSQSDSVLSYMPLAIGNQWQYEVHYVVTGPSNIDTTYYSLSIVERDTIMPNGYQYQVIKNSNFYQEYNYIHIDSATACVYEYENDSSRGFKTDSLKCSEGDWFGLYHHIQCIFIDTATVLDYETWIMTIDWPMLGFSDTHTLAMDIGMVFHEKSESEGTWVIITTRTLVYAKINGSEFGELVTVKNDINNELTDFNLHQNYPNPFNPVTTIKYQIPEFSFVTLKIYDVLGNEIETLVNEEKAAGSYAIEFGADGLTSGIYFYQLKADGYMETKKMILIK